MSRIIYKDNNISINILSTNKQDLIIAVPKKYIKRAVDRNLMKRRIRTIIHNIRKSHDYLIKFGFKVICIGLYKYNDQHYNNIINIIHKNAIKYTAGQYMFRKNKVYSKKHKISKRNKRM